MPVKTSQMEWASEPERALLEMLDDVPQKQSLDEARKIMEPLFTLRPELLQALTGC